MTPAVTAAQDFLSDVSCIHPGDCIAAGGNNAGDSGYGSPLGALWNTSWHVAVPPLPHGALGGELNGVSCKTGGCVAVGYYYANATSYHALADFWNGTHWVLLPQPAVPLNSSNFILGIVSCTSSTSCTAVGYYTVGSNTFGLIETLQGGAWHAARAPSPSASYTALGSVSCPAAGTCVAVGTYESHVNGFTLVDVLSGGHWAQAKTPTPQTASGYQDALQGVSCPTATSCVAVGDYGKASGNTFLATSFSETWNGSAWTVQPIASTGGHNVLDAVSCPSATYCVAAGGAGAYTTYNDGHVMAQVWNGTSWSPTTLASDPAGAGSVLFGVACVSAQTATTSASCIAVGDIGPLKTAGHGLSAFWNGTSWKRLQVA